MNILLIGSSKFIGSHLLNKLIYDNNVEKIICTYLNNNLSNNFSSNKLSFRKCDVRYLSEISSIIKEIYADIIIYMASSRYFPAPANNEDHFDINTNGIKNLITACSQNKLNPKIIFVNSGASKLYSNEDNDSYTFSKKNSSRLFHKSIKNKEIEGTEINLFTPYGPHDYKYRLIQSSIIDLLNGKHPLIKNPNSRRDFIYIDDVIEVMEKVIFSNQKIETIDIGSSNPVFILDVIKEIYKIMNVKEEINIQENSSEEEISFMKADLSVAQEKFNWHPKTSLIKGLSNTVEWIKSNYKNYYE